MINSLIVIQARNRYKWRNFYFVMFVSKKLRQSEQIKRFPLRFSFLRTLMCKRSRAYRAFRTANLSLIRWKILTPSWHDKHANLYWKKIPLSFSILTTEKSCVSYYFFIHSFLGVKYARRSCSGEKTAFRTFIYLGNLRQLFRGVIRVMPPRGKFILLLTENSTFLCRNRRDKPIL